MNILGVPAQLTKYVRADFQPKVDITAYELAQLLIYFHGKGMTEDEWDKIGAMQRHFVRIT
jgi:hypothetical protein